MICYVHCSLGVNRSPATIILYLMKYEGYTLYNAYKTVAVKKDIWTAPYLFDILYNEALKLEKDPISPLKILTHEMTIVNNDDTRYVFSLYDTIHLELINRLID